MVDEPHVSNDAQADAACATFALDQWYVAACSSELDAARPLARKLCGEPVVLFRDPNGMPHALLDRRWH